MFSSNEVQKKLVVSMFSWSLQAPVSVSRRSKVDS